MATAALEVYRDAGGELRPDLDLDDFLAVADLHEVRTAEESREFTLRSHPPCIVISSSGMATGGRVLHHLERMLPDPRNAVVLSGYQAVGTRGRALAEGAPRLKMRGHYVGVKAEILNDEEFSVHADATDLISWLRNISPAPAMVFCVHGEPHSSAVLAERIERELGLDAVVPTLDEVVALEAGPVVPPVDSRNAKAVVPAADRAGSAGASPSAATAGSPREEPAAAPPARSPTPADGVPSPPHVSLTVDGVPVRAARVEADLASRADDDSLVFEGTISIRMKRS